MNLQSWCINRIEFTTMRYFKQYGAQRTGTNYLRALLEKNFADITVLMHTLGGKHGCPVDLQEYLSRFKGDPPGFVEAATAAIPAENSLPFRAEQRMYMQAHAAAIYEAVETKKLHYLISIKEPYAWVGSRLKYGLQNIRPSNPEYNVPPAELTRRRCREYNLLYRSYLGFSQRFPKQSTIVPYDSLLSDPTGFLSDIGKRLELNPVSEIFSGIENAAFPTIWDQDKSLRSVSGKPFDPDYYLKRKYLGCMDPEVIAALESEIDWELMKHFGYAKFECTVIR